VVAAARQGRLTGAAVRDRVLGGLAGCADRALEELGIGDLTGAQLLGERAAITGFFDKGAISPGGSCRLLDAADGGIALNLARDEDWTLLPAWLESDGPFDWLSLSDAVTRRAAVELVERGRMLGLAVALDELPERVPPLWHASSPRRRGPSFAATSNLGPRRGGDGPIVIDLSSLWAGPLCGRLLLKLGARVIKVESTTRPDGARRGPPAFFELMNAGKESVQLDLRSHAGRDKLRALLQRADIVIEGSRPRALRQMGIVAEDFVAEHPHLTWISITGHGRDPAHENWIAYGDDAGVAAGLSAVVREATGERLICGDAVADPLTGVHAALAAWQGWRAGGGGLVSLALVDVVRHCIEKMGPYSS
jgi:hypothetical protein